MNRYILGLVGCLIMGGAFSQVPSLSDNLKRQLEIHSKKDTIWVNIMNELSKHHQWSDFNKSLGYAEQALKIAEGLAYQKGIATANYLIAHCFWSFGDGELAVSKGLEAANIAEKENLSAVMAESYRILSRCYYDQNEIAKAVVYIDKARHISLDLKDWDLLSRVYNLAGVIQAHDGNTDSALALYNKALQITKEHMTGKAQVSQILSNIGERYRKNNADLAFQYFTMALQSARESNNRSAEAGIMADIGNAYAQKGNYREADKHLRESLRLARDLELKRIVRFSYASLVNLKLSEGKMPEAFEYLQNYYNVNDSLLNIAKTREIVELETRYEAEKNEQRIALLEQEKRSQAILRNGLIVGAALMILALLVIYRLQRLRTREAKKLLAAQEELNVKLKETDSLKSRFFTNISHEFRTPLTLILSPLENKISKTHPDSLESKELQIVQRNANRLLELVNQLLDLSKLEANKMELVIKDNDLHTFLNVLSASFNSMAESMQIKFTKHLSISGSTVFYDADKLEKIISNILFNAFKFTPPGGHVTLSVDTNGEANNLIIKVSDTGNGIPFEEQEYIFSPFYQSKYTLDNGQPGTGLGLSLVNELVKLYKGKINLESQPGKGTNIVVELPVFNEEWNVQRDRTDHIMQTSQRALIVEETVSENLESDSSANDSILIVEDNADLRNFIASSFSKQFSVLKAKDGKEGLKIAVEKVPSLIISDVMMPEMNGVELTDQLKSDERTSHIPVVLLTAKADGSSKMEGLRSGADDYLTKPFSTEELQIRVNNLIDQRKKLVARFKDRLSQPTQEIKEASLDEKFIQRARIVVENNLSNYNFGVEMFAHEMNLSRTQLFRKFKALIDTPPSEFINDIRLQRAAKMIRFKTDTLAQISYAVGFNQQSYFTKCFRKKFGVSPTEYANLN